MKEYTKPEVNIVEYQTENIMVVASAVGTGIINDQKVKYSDIDISF